MKEDMTAPHLELGEDPIRIREHLVRSRELANIHGLPSVVVGIAGSEGDLMIPELLGFIESALRVEDAIFRMTRERAVLFLADVDLDQAGRIVDRLISEFSARFPSAAQPGMRMGFFQVEPGCAELAVKEVLPAVFPAASGPSH
jgi:hypothetical protein